MNDKFDRDLVAVQDELLRYAYKLTMDREEANDLLLHINNLKSCRAFKINIMNLYTRTRSKCKENNFYYIFSLH